MLSIFMFLAIALLILLVLCLVLLAHSRYRLYWAKLNLIPGPKACPIIGNLLLLSFDRTGVIPFLKRLLAEYGSIFRLYVFGTSHVIINDVASLEKVLGSTRFIKKSSDYDFLMPWLQEGLLTSTGLKWHTRRKILTPTFHFKILEDYLPVFNKNSEILVQKLHENVNKPFIEINNFITLCTLDSICETAMGTRINAQNGKEVEYVHAVQRMSEVFQLRQLRPWLYNNKIFSLSSLGREQRKLLRILHGFSSKIIKQQRADYRAYKNNPAFLEEKASKRRRMAFLDLLIEISESEHQLTDLDIREEVDTFMFEGHDTTSSALSWAFHLLGSHLEAQERLVEELNNIFGDSDRQPTFEDLGQMKYLEQVIKETLRLYPSVPGFSRQLQADTEIMGYNIPAGANVSVIPILLHYNPDLYPNPEKFDPDRFTTEAIQARPTYAYLPFSAGPRSCIGQRFAQMELKVIISTVLRYFHIEALDKPEDITLLMELILRPKDPLKIKLTPRKRGN